MNPLISGALFIYESGILARLMTYIFINKCKQISNKAEEVTERIYQKRIELFIETENGTNLVYLLLASLERICLHK